MHSLFLLPLALLASTATAQINASTITNTAEFSAAANQIVSDFIPPSIVVAVGVAVQSAASVASITGDINSIVQSALTAATPPPFLTAIPSEYQSNVQGIESAISSLRQAVSSTSTTSMMPNATANGTLVTMTNSAGMPYTTLIAATGTGVNGTGSNSTVSGMNLGSSSMSAALSSSSASATVANTKSSAFAVPTQVPVMAAGIVGMVGLLAVL
ncbi:hypothetical protein MMC12_000246 [Toensbergia leucococca]|nr:hypothetical protein [Toensbergia leucococca]